MITTYTMSNIKNYVEDLKYQSLKDYKEKMTVDFEAYLEANVGISADISRYESICEEAKKLEKMYRKSGWLHGYSQDLKSIIKSEYCESRQDEVQKIQNQFNAIINKLKTMRNSDKALEFLGLCGIELPKQIKPPVPDIPVDPEFIKSVLPAAKQLTTTKQEETQNE